MTTNYEDLPVVATVAQVAEILDCSERHIRTLITSGDLVHIRLGRLVKIPRHALLEILGANAVNRSAPQQVAKDIATKVGELPDD